MTYRLSSYYQLPCGAYASHRSPRVVRVMSRLSVALYLRSQRGAA